MELLLGLRFVDIGLPPRSPVGRRRPRGSTAATSTSSVTEGLSAPEATTPSMAGTHPLGQQPRQGRSHPRFALPRRELQDPQVLLGGSLGLAPGAVIVGHTKTTAREQIAR